MKPCCTLPDKAHALLILSILILLILPVSRVANAQSTATVSAVEGDNIIIDLGTAATPAIGDTVEVSFELGGESFVIGTWRITRLDGKTIEASKIKADLPAEQGMAVQIKPAEKNNDVIATTGQQETAVASPGQEELFWLKNPQQATVAPATVTAGDLQFTRTADYRQVWIDKGSGARRDFAVWRAVGQNGFYPLGDVANASPWPGDRYPKPAFETVLVKNALPPVSYEKVWSSAGSRSNRPFSSWAPVAAEGYQCLGEVGSQSEDAMPSLDAIRCLPARCVTEINLDKKIWDDKGSGARLDFSAWLIPKTNTYVGNASHSRPTKRFYSISDSCF